MGRGQLGISSYEIILTINEDPCLNTLMYTVGQLHANFSWPPTIDYAAQIARKWKMFDNKGNTYLESSNGNFQKEKNI